MAKNIFDNKNILIIKKEKISSYYDFMINSIIEQIKPKKIFYIKFSGIKNIYSVNRDIKNLVKQKNINVLIAASYFFFDPILMHSFQKKIFRIRIDGDDDWLFDHYTRWYAQLFDLSLTTSNIVKSKLNQFGYNSLSIPYFYPKYELPKKLYKELLSKDVVFVGLVRGKQGREKYINHIKQNGIKIHIFGNDSYKLSKEQMDYIYYHSKIVINFSGVNNDMKDINNFEPDISRKTQIKARVFEVLRTGGFLVTEYTPDIDYFFTDKKDLVTFRSKEELLNIIKFYLKNEKERKKIAKSGLEKFNKFYQKDIYAPRLIKEISKYENFKTIINKFYWPYEAKRFISRFVDFNDLFKFIIFERSYIKFIKIRFIFLRYFYSLLRIIKL